MVREVRNSIAFYGRLSSSSEIWLCRLSLCVGEAASAACGVGGSAWQHALALSLSVFLPPQPPLGVTRMNSTQV